MTHDYTPTPEGRCPECGHRFNAASNATDIRRGRLYDPCGCALRNAAVRVFNIPNAMIGAVIAYIPQRDSRGKHYIARMVATESTRKAIKAFDETGEMPEAGFRFVPAPFSATKEYISDEGARHRERKRRGRVAQSGPKATGPRSIKHVER